MGMGVDGHATFSPFLSQAPLEAVFGSAPSLFNDNSRQKAFSSFLALFQEIPHPYATLPVFLNLQLGWGF